MENRRLNQVIQQPQYQQYCKEIAELEKSRIFCKHDMNHFLDVARLAWIYNLEGNYGLFKEVVYAAAFLHDIGRHLQYREDIPHDEASARLAEPLLEAGGFKSDEIADIKKAILAHRRRAAGSQFTEPLSEVLYRADKASRNCFACAAEAECSWTAEEKNMYIVD